MVTESDFIELRTLTPKEIEWCEFAASRAKNAPRLGEGFPPELAFGKWLDEDMGWVGVYNSCLRQQARSHAQKGPDMADIDVKSTTVMSTLEGISERFHLNVQEDDLRFRGHADKFVLILRFEGRFFFVGWATHDEMLQAESCFLGDKPGRKKKIKDLHPPKELLHDRRIHRA